MTPEVISNPSAGTSTRSSAGNPYNDIAETDAADVENTYTTLVSQLGDLNLAYLHMIESADRTLTTRLRKTWPATFILTPFIHLAGGDAWGGDRRSRHKLARDICHGKRGQIMPVYRERQEDHLGTLGRSGRGRRASVRLAPGMDIQPAGCSGRRRAREGLAAG
ncbi:hypothetical protein [Streptomyces melanosporofaciens]|uniref:hypothetical protein n=1 Tax=Streptomyces melanosporofaciens TaxID=67327 RepID=UPI001431E5D5